MLQPPAPAALEERAAVPDLMDIKGQETAKRALEVSAAGGHNLLMLFIIDQRNSGTRCCASLLCDRYNLCKLGHNKNAPL